MYCSPNWRDAPNVPWVRILVCVDALPAVSGDFRVYDEDKWAELGQIARYRYEQVRSDDGYLYLAWRAIPDEGEKVEALKLFAKTTLLQIFRCSIDTSKWRFKNAGYGFVPRDRLIFESFNSGDDAYLCPT